MASYSPVLKAAFNSDFVEGQTQTYNLEVADADAFQLLVQWLYTKSIQFCLTDAEFNSLRDPSDDSRPPSEEVLWKLQRHSMRLVNLWITADYLQMPRLQNLAVDGLEHLSRQLGVAQGSTLHYLYENVPTGAPLRQLVVEHYVLFVSHSVCQRYPHIFPKQMLVGLIVAHKLKEELNRAQLPQPDPFTDRAEFIKRFHVPEDVQSPRNGAA